jgi:hypothetical protein
MHPDLEQLGIELTAIRTDAGRLTTGISGEQFHWRPAAGQWSICKCLMHLNVVDGLDAELLARAVIEARAKGLTGGGPFRYGAISSWFIRWMEPPPRLKTKAPGVYVPPPLQPVEAVMDEFYRIHDRLTGLLPMADGLDLARIRVPTPVARFIRFSFTQRLRLIAAHDRRHLWQAWRVPAYPGFPG